MSNWDFLICDAQGNVQGELNHAKEKKVSTPLSRVITGTFSVDTSDPWVNVLRRTDETFIKAYRNNILMGQGPVITTQKTRSSQSAALTVTWGGIGWRLGIRLIEESKSNTGVEYGKPAEAEWEDMGQMAVKIINGLNSAPLIPATGVVAKNILNPATELIALGLQSTSGALAQANTGIRVGSVLPCAKSSVGPWFYQNALSGISLIASPLNAFDWEIEPVEPFSDNIGMVFGQFNCQPAFGGLREDVVFEWGDGKHNIVEFQELIDASGLLNRGYSTPEGFPENSKDSVLVQYDYPAMQEHGTVYEDIIPNDAVAEELRNRVLQEQVTVRRNPKSVITFKPTNAAAPGVLPSFGSDYSLGDIVMMRAVEYGVVTFEGLVRVYEVDFEIDEVGNETASPILIQQET